MAPSGRAGRATRATRVRVVERVGDRQRVRPEQDLEQQRGQPEAANPDQERAAHGRQAERDRQRGGGGHQVRADDRAGRRPADDQADRPVRADRPC